MARDRAALLARVNKLLALATSPNVHEAAAAAARAQAMIEAHRLEGLLAAEREVSDVDDGRDAPLEVSKRLRRFKVVLATVLGEHNACVAWTEQRGSLTALCLAGRPEDREVTAALYAGLVVTIEWLSASHASIHGAGRDRHWHEAFRIGAAESVGERLGAGTAEADATTSATDSKTALLKRDASARRDAVDRFVAERLGLGAGRSFSVDSHGYKRGRIAGAALPVATPVKGSRGSS